MHAELYAAFVYLLLVILPMQWSIFVSWRHVSLQTRILDFERTLPITARAIILQRAATAWVVLVVPYLAASCVWIVQLPNPQQTSALAAVVGRGSLAITAGILVLFAYRPRRLRLHTPELVALSAVAIAIVLAPGFVETRLVGTALVVLIVALGTYLWTRLERWSPVDDPRVAAPVSPDAAAPLPVRVLGPLRWTLLRSTSLRPNVVIGAVLGGALLSLAGSEMMFILLWMPAVIVDGAVRQGLNMLHGIDPFPMRRRRLLPFIAVPSLIVIVGSAGVRALRLASYTSIGCSPIRLRSIGRATRRSLATASTSTICASRPGRGGWL